MTQSSPCVSVVMPLYNKENDVTRAIGSALAQTYRDFKLIVVNDGSTDRSAKVVRGIDDPRIRLVEQVNAGVSAARNRGIAEAQTDLVTFLDADDEWLPDFLATIVRLQTSFPKASVFATAYRVREPSGPERSITLNGLPSGQWEGLMNDYFAVAACSDPPIWSSAVAVKKAALEDIGGFPVGVRSGEDLLTWARLAVRFPVVYSTLPLAVFWSPGDVADRPGRFLETDDWVGEQLKLLFEQLPVERHKSLSAYLRRWHDMRAAIFLQLGKRRCCLKEVCKALGYGGGWCKPVCFALMACVPFIHPGALYRGLKKLVQH